MPAKPDLYRRVQKRSLEELRAEFPTYESAIAEIRILDYAIRRGEAISLRGKRSGRKPNIAKLLIGKKRSGRPSNRSMESAVEKLRPWDEYRASLYPILSGKGIQKKYRVKSISDKRAVDHLVEEKFSDKPSHERLSIKKELLGEIDALRNFTGIFTRKRGKNKRKTSR